MLRSRIGMTVSAALLLGAVSITGCGVNQNAGKTGVQPNSVRGAGDGKIGINSTRGDKDMNKMEMSRDLADRIAAMAEVRSANVMLMGKSAYVAVILEDAAGGIHAKSNMPGALGSNTRAMNEGRSSTMDGADMGRGMNDMSTDMGRIKTGMSRDMGNMNNNMDNNNMNMNMNSDEAITMKMKEKISAEVKKYAPQINAVYVSANPDFVERMNVYGEEARAGHPLKGFANEFRTMVERIFPMRSDNR
ncbi:YhcN/YlaJ family sporulation lipoprotein [Paenibacillus donghaensis]|nr:YhcN/YlaJ family sporulation lipoprotein [Paenibacillus donghaensis]